MKFRIVLGLVNNDVWISFHDGLSYFLMILQYIASNPKSIATIYISFTQSVFKYRFTVCNLVLIGYGIMIPVVPVLFAGYLRGFFRIYNFTEGAQFINQKCLPRFITPHIVVMNLVKKFFLIHHNGLLFTKLTQIPKG